MRFISSRDLKNKDCKDTCNEALSPKSIIFVAFGICSKNGTRVGVGGFVLAND
jgi:hypothetical protein